MKIHLSNYEVRAYKKQNGNLSFHCTTVLMADYGWNFSASYFEQLDVHFILGDDTQVNFDLSMNCDTEFVFDGKFNTVTLNLSAVTNLTSIEEQVINMVVNGCLDFPHGKEQFYHEKQGVLRKKYFGL